MTIELDLKDFKIKLRQRTGAFGGREVYCVYYKDVPIANIGEESNQYLLYNSEDRLEGEYHLCDKVKTPDNKLRVYEYFIRVCKVIAEVSNIDIFGGTERFTDMPTSDEECDCSECREAMEKYDNIVRRNQELVDSISY